MSTHRKITPSLRIADDTRSDAYAIEAMKASLISQPTTQIRVSVDEHKDLRKEAPANVPFRRTLKWVESLPAHVRPINLLHRFARVANLIAATWGNRRHFESYMQSLRTDKRGNRKGFPPDVLAELSVLEAYRFAIEDRDSAWATMCKRG